MTVTFKPIEIDAADGYQQKLSRTPQIGSDYSFLNIWSWAKEYGLEWAWDDELVWIRQAFPEPVWWAPIGPWDKIDWSAKFSRFKEQKASFIRVPEILSSIWQKDLDNQIDIKSAREHWDYLYDIEELITLNGNRFHKKKNLLKQFTRKYDYRLVPLDREVIQMAIDMQSDWCLWKDCESSETLLSENRVIQRVLNSWEKLSSATGSALLVGNKMVAYTIAEKMPDENLVIHFEKGDTEFKGAYQAINQMHLENYAADLKIANRQQDLGNKNLRKAKESYQPIGFVKKNSVFLK